MRSHDDIQTSEEERTVKVLSSFFYAANRNAADKSNATADACNIYYTISNSPSAMM